VIDQSDKETIALFLGLYHVFVVDNRQPRHILVKFAAINMPENMFF
jgi:hypothetical protein